MDGLKKRLKVKVQPKYYKHSITQKKTAKMLSNSYNNKDGGMARLININADIAEGWGAYEIGNDAVLMTIINYAKLGLRHKDQATREKSFDKILAAGNRAAKITNGILGMARNRSGKREPIDLVQLVEDTLVLLEREMSKYHIAVEKYFKPLPKTAVSPNQIQQVLKCRLIQQRLDVRALIVSRHQQR